MINLQVSILTAFSIQVQAVFELLYKRVVKVDFE